MNESSIAYLKTHSKLSRRVFIAGVGAGSLFSTPVFAQLGNLGDIGQVLGRAGGVSLNSLLRGRMPVTTSLPDAKWGLPERDQFTPPQSVRKLSGLERTPRGGFILKAGYYEFNAQSYCLHAGTHGPGGGDGYLYAPTLGSAEEAVIAIRQNSYQHPDIPQQDIQVLLWAIVARARFETLGPRQREVAARLLTPQQLAKLNRTGLDAIPAPVMNRLLAQAPPGLRQVLQAEGQLRTLLSGPGVSFATLEQVAVLSGVAPLGPGSLPVPSGRWSGHPDGYLIRYLPRGYSHTLVQVWVEPGSSGIGKELDLSQQIAVPGNTARQRLGQSGRERPGS
jgi:hypothetical protein